MILELITTHITTLLVVCILSGLFYWTFFSNGTANLPPGPPTVPILGSWPFFDKTQEQTFLKFAKKYGDVFTFYLFNSTLCVVLNGYDTIKEAFIKHGDVFSGRTNLKLFQIISKNHGIAQAKGDLWKLQRRFTLTSLRDFGMGRLSLEGKILQEVKIVLEDFNKQYGAPFDPTYIIGPSVSSIIASILFGDHFRRDDPRYKTFLFYMQRNLRNMALAVLVSFFPWLKYVPGDPVRFNAMIESLDELEDFFKEQIDEHKKNYNPNEITDVVYAFLKEMYSQQDDPHTTFTDLQLVKLIGDLFMAGSETSATTLKWGLYYMIQNPGIQKKAQDEIDQVVDKDRLPSVTDRPNTPYLEACIMEIQRMGNIAPRSLLHATTEDTTFRGYFIPKDTIIFTNLTSVMTDPKIFKNPDKFDPENFLDENGKIKKMDEFIPFSIGRRACPGASLAQMELFLFMATMLQKFTFKLEDGKTLPKAERYDGVVIAPPVYDMQAITR